MIKKNSNMLQFFFCSRLCIITQGVLEKSIMLKKSIFSSRLKIITQDPSKKPSANKKALSSSHLCSKSYHILEKLAPSSCVNCSSSQSDHILEKLAPSSCVKCSSSQSDHILEKLVPSSCVSASWNLKILESSSKEGRVGSNVKHVIRRSINFCTLIL